jgi:hypothetical protein
MFFASVSGLWWGTGESGWVSDAGGAGRLVKKSFLTTSGRATLATEVIRSGDLTAHAGCQDRVTQGIGS